MARDLIYLDYNANAVPRPEALAAASAAMAHVGNPSSVHTAGRKAAAILAGARDQVAALADVPARSVVFTSGATEANNMAIMGAPQQRLIISAIEHDSVREPAHRAGKDLVVIGVDGHGVLDMNALETALNSAPEPALVSVMAANNETGVIQPTADIARMVHDHGSVFHCDAVQAAGKIDLAPITAVADLISLSAHKCSGPMGAGALIVRAGTGRTPLINGGGQELGARAGTENLSGIAGFGAAAEMALYELRDMTRLVELRDALEAELLALSADIAVAGRDAPRTANTSCIVMPGMPAETQVMAFDLAGIAVSAGAACSSGKIHQSHVLKAMGFDDAQTRSAIRVSMGWQTKPQDIEAFIAVWKDIYSRADKGAAAKPEMVSG